MANVLTAEAIWYDDVANLDMRTLDVQALSTGKIGVAFGGDKLGTGVVYTALYDLTTASLGPIRENLLPGNPSGGVPVTAVRRIELDAGVNGGMIATIHMANSAVGLDGNFALLTQTYAGNRPLGSPLPVNPGTPLQNTSDAFATLARADGSYFTFSTEIGGGANLSNGISMTRFAANGSMMAAPKLVVPDFQVFPAIGLEANPETPDATLMTNGHIGLVYKQNTATGSSVIVFQEMMQIGKAVGSPIIMADAAALAPKIITLAGGGMVAVWMAVQNTVGGVIHAQRFTAAGALVGNVFDVAAVHTGSESAADVVATADGGFAVSWFNGSHPVGRLFDARGQAKGNDFSLTDTGAHLDLYGNWGLTVSGTQLIGFTSGSEVGGHSVLLGEVFATTASLGKTMIGGVMGNTQTGTALDDVARGLGGKDKISGLAGNDILDGGDGDDSITGGDGRDVITGGLGHDRLTGNAGADVFMFNTRPEGGDVITDFNAAQGDKLGFDNMGFGYDLIPGFFQPLIFCVVTNGATTNPATGGFFFNTTTHVLSYDYDGAGAYARVDIATLPNVASLSNYDLMVI